MSAISKDFLEDKLGCEFSFQGNEDNDSTYVQITDFSYDDNGKAMVTLCEDGRCGFDVYWSEVEDEEMDKEVFENGVYHY